MRTLGLSLASIVGALVLGAVVAATACSSGGTSPTDPLAQLELDTGVGWAVLNNDSFGTPSLLAPRSLPPVWEKPDVPRSQAAMDFFVKYGGVFQMTDPAHELSAEASGAFDRMTFASFKQRESAASVYGTRITMVFDSDGRIAFVSGLYIPGLHSLSTTAALSTAEAEAKAEADMRSRFPARFLRHLESTPAPALTLFAFGAAPVLAYERVLSYSNDDTANAAARQRVVMHYLIDANTGAVVDAFSLEASQYAGTDVKPINATGKGELGGSPKSFPVLGTDDAGSVVPPYYMQDEPLAAASKLASLMFVQTPTATPILSSDDDDLSKWDTKSATNPGSAVDAYTYLREAETWWQLHGRNGYDDKAGTLGILVHEPLLATKPCVNNAYWDWVNTIHVCPSSTLSAPFASVAASVDLGMMAHEFQHAVTQSALDLLYEGQTGAIDESLSDTFAELISHDMPPNDADCIIGEDWVPPRGVRNMMNPHLSLVDPHGPQPDAMSDTNYYPGPDDNGGVHRDDGIPNRAWSLATFGGIDDTTKRGVHASKALGWRDSETLYVGLITVRPVPTAAKFADLAVGLVGIARAEFGLSSPQEEAVACSWYAAAVLSADDLRKLDVDPCACPHPTTAMCDAGSDAGSDPDAGSDAEVETPGVHCQIPFHECTTYLDFASTTEAAWAEQCTTGDEHGTLVPSCPTAGMIGCCTTSLRDDAGVDGTVVVCYYEPLSAASVAPACESALKGTWSSVEEVDAGTEPDAATDAATDAAPEPPSSGPTHC